MGALSSYFIRSRRFIFIALSLSSVFFLSYLLYSIDGVPRKRGRAYSSSVLPLNNIDSVPRNGARAFNSFDWPLSILFQNDVYKLKLNYVIGSTDTHVFMVPENSALWHGSPNVFLTQEDLERTKDRRWRLPINPIVYFAHPQPIDLGNTISRLLTHQPIAVPPINGDAFQFVSIPKSVCFPENDSTHEFDVVVIIKSTVSSFVRRNTFRQTYSEILNANNIGLRIGMIFSMGMPRSKADNIFQRGGYPFKLTGRRGDALNPFTLNRTKILLELEIESYDDLLIGAFEDTYFNLTIKAHHAFVWASTFCQKSRPVILFVDDDVPYSPDGLEKALSSMPIVKRRTLFHGLLAVNNRVIRFRMNKDQQWALTKSEAPWPIYSTYLYGLYSLIGFDHVERMALGMMFTKYFSVDDAWIGLVATRLNITMRSIYELMRTKELLIKNRLAFEPVEPSVQ